MGKTSKVSLSLHVLTYLGSAFEKVFRPVVYENFSAEEKAQRASIEAAVSELCSQPLAPLSDDLRDADFSIADISHELKRMDPTKALGPDGFHTAFLKFLPESDLAIVSLVFNFFWSNGIVPSIWKQADVVVIYKDGPKDLPDSFRPISLTCILCKLYERVVLARVAPSVRFDESQAGFRAKHSCGDQIYALHNAGEEALLAKSPTHRTAVFLDFSKAFDRVNHSSLLLKLHRKGVCSRGFHFFRSFLTSRSFRVSASGFFSEPFSILAGVPQGSVSGPFCFLVLIDDLPARIRGVSARPLLLADDVGIHGNSLGAAGDSELKAGLRVASSWTRENLMLLNLRKCVAVVFTRKQTVLRSPPAIYLDGQPISFVPTFKYLGLWFSSRLSWSTHVEHVVKKAKASANRIRSIINAHGPSPRVIRSLVLAIVRAQLCYGFPYWCPSDSDFKRMRAQLLRPLKAVLGLPQSAHSLSVLAEFGIPTLQRYWEQQLILFHARVSRLAREPLRAPSLPMHPTAAIYANTVLCQLSVSSRASSLFKEWKEELNQMSPLHARCADSINFRAFNLSSSAAQKLSLALSFQDLQAAQDGALRRFKKEPGTSLYLLHDAKPVAALRARLRFARSALKEHQYRFDLVESDRCEQCHGRPRPVESVGHVLLHCPAYKDARDALRNSLHSLRPPIRLTANTVLGELGKLPNAVRNVALSSTGDFLTAVHSIRAL